MNSKSSFTRRLLLSGSLLAGMLGAQGEAALAQTSQPEGASSADNVAPGDTASPVPATAPASAATTADTADIIVTANRREEFSQRTAVSLTAASGAAIAQRNILTSEDLARIVPGLNATAATGSGVTTYVIRGVGQTDFSDHQEQPNANYQDGVYLPFATAASVPLFDMQRVEALRGPQGTLFGRNATGGLIQYISNKPETGESGALEGAYGTRDLRRLEGFVNGGTNLVAGRLSFFYQAQDGNIENTLGRARGDKSVYALRGQIRIQPASGTKTLLRADGFNQGGTPIGYLARPSYFVNGVNTDLPADVDAYGTGPGKDPYGYRSPYKGLKIAIDEPGVIRKRVRNYSMTISQNVGSATLTSVTSYGTMRNTYIDDSDSTPLSTFVSKSTARGHDFQQEFRINGGDGPFRYTAGLFYLSINGHYTLYNDIVIPPSLTPILGLPAGRLLESDAFRLRTHSQAAYGQVEYDLSDKVTALLGARYTWDQFRFGFQSQCDQTVVGACSFFGGPGGPGLSVVGIAPVALHDKNGDWSGKAQVNFKPIANVLLYASASKGVKAAGYSTPLSNVLPSEPLYYQPEKLYAFEIGEKAQFLDNRVTVNGSAYYYDYKDFQAFLFNVVAPQVLNRDARVYGGELEITARPTRTLTANLAVAYNNFAIKEVFPGITNQRPNNAPRLQVLWGLNKTFDIGSDNELILSYSGRRISRTFYNLVNTPISAAKAYDVHDFTARVNIGTRWYVAGFLNNAFDKRYQVGVFDLGALGYNIRLYGERRTFSAAVGAKF